MKTKLFIVPRKLHFALIAAISSLGIATLSPVAKASLISQGTSFNGIALNGVALNGVVLNGTNLNGANLNGANLNGTARQGTYLNEVRQTSLPQFDPRIAEPSSDQLDRFNATIRLAEQNPKSATAPLAGLTLSNAEFSKITVKNGRLVGVKK